MSRFDSRQVEKAKFAFLARKKWNISVYIESVAMGEAYE